MEAGCISTRKDVLRFVGDVFHVLECVAEPFFADATQKYFQWSCVRVLDAYELQFFHVPGPVVEIRPTTGTERFLVSRRGSDLRIETRSEFAKRVLDAVDAASDEARLGLTFLTFEKAIRRSLDILGIAHEANVRFFHKQFPEWTTILTTDCFAVRDLGEAMTHGFHVNPPAALLVPENELRQWKKYLLTRRWSQNEVGKKRWVLEVRQVPIAHRLLFD